MSRWIKSDIESGCKNEEIKFPRESLAVIIRDKVTRKYEINPIKEPLNMSING
jgi:hypothetical protein